MDALLFLPDGQEITKMTEPNMTSKYTTFISCFTLLLTLMFSGFCHAGEHATPHSLPHPPKHEVRAVWLTTIGGLDWPHSYAQSARSIEKQKAELVDLLNRLHRANINTVLLQTRIRGTVIYPSVFEPWDGCCSGVPGKSPGYDPLQFAIEECHKRGMELHAWVVTIPLGKWSALGCKSIRKKHPKMVVKTGADGFLNPAHAETAKYIAGICREITCNYDIDGIHLDYIRYPEDWKLNISKTQARANITNIVSEICRQVKSLKPWVKMSCAPIGKYDDLYRYSSRGWNAYNKGCQDVRLWLKEGLMDQIYPMMYFRGDQFYPFAMDWNENSYGRHVVPGLGVYFMSPREANWSAEIIERQMNVLRGQGMGYAFFRNKFFCDDLKGLYSFTADQFNTYPALVPPMKGYNTYTPSKPKHIRQQTVEGIDMVTWEAVNDQAKHGGMAYNLYASDTYPVDTEDASNLLLARYQGTAVNIRHHHKRYYAVTATNRYGYESVAVQQEDVVKESPSNITLLSNDGYTMQLPAKGHELDADYILLKSVAGNTIATLPYRGNTANISRISEGFYSVYSLNRKGVNHRLGFIRIKRNR